MMKYKVGPIYECVLVFFPLKILKEKIMKCYWLLLLNCNFDLLNAMFVKASIFFWTRHTFIMIKKHNDPNNTFLPLKGPFWKSGLDYDSLSVYALDGYYISFQIWTSVYQTLLYELKPLALNYFFYAMELVQCFLAQLHIFSN